MFGFEDDIINAVSANEDNTVFIKPDLILASIGKDKCDSGWFASRILSDMGFNVIPTIYEELEPKRTINICRSNMPLYEKVSTT